LYGWAAFKVMRRRLLPERGSGGADLTILDPGQAGRDGDDNSRFALLPSGHGSANAVQARAREDEVSRRAKFALAKSYT
jgi:hypothetical protein